MPTFTINVPIMNNRYSSRYSPILKAHVRESLSEVFLDVFIAFCHGDTADQIIISGEDHVNIIKAILCNGVRDARLYAKNCELWPEAEVMIRQYSGYVQVLAYEEETTNRHFIVLKFEMQYIVSSS